MRKNLVSIMALLLVLATALPVFALDVTYGGLFRARLSSNNNTFDGVDTDTNGARWDDNENYIDQRMRFYMNFVASQNLKMVVAFEQDTLWGDNRRELVLIRPENTIAGAISPTQKILTGHRDTVGLELKNAYVDFAIPCTPTRAMIGLQPIAAMTGWIVDEDFTAAMTVTDLKPITIKLGYISEGQVDVTSSDDNVDDLFFAVNYAEGPLSAELNFLYQNAHDQLSATYDPSFPAWYSFISDPKNPLVTLLPDLKPYVTFYQQRVAADEANLFDIGLTATYKLDWMNATLNYVQNLGSYDDIAGDSHDYRGFMVEAITNFYSGPFTFTLGGFYTSGQDPDSNDDDVNSFAYPIGASHYWSEIMGLGTLNDEAINDAGSARANGYHGNNLGQYGTGDVPSNLWTINAGAAWQAMPKTKLTFNYYYIGTSEDVITGLDDDGDLQWGTDVGHEFDMYVDQEIVDKLMLRLVAAYLVAGDAFTVINEDDNAYELGARLQWSF